MPHTAPLPRAPAEQNPGLETFLADPRHPGLRRWAHALWNSDPDALAAALPRLASPMLDYTSASALKRLLDRVRARQPESGTRIRLAVLAGFTSQPLADLVDFYLAAEGLHADVYLPEFGTFRQEMLDPTAPLHAFAPDFVLLLPTWRDIGHAPAPEDDPATIDRKLAAEVTEWTGYWHMLRRSGAQIVQDLFVPPPWRPLGNLDAIHPAGLSRFCRRLNETLISAAPPTVAFHDLEALAGGVGRWEWQDERFFLDAKLPCAPEALPTYAHSLATLVLGRRGKAHKCLALDLDNTLWGGVIGDDGLEGIRIGQGDPESEAYLAFQLYALNLKRRGVILAVCSKNTEAIAREAFERHPGMALKLSDIACFMANWDDKATNLDRIAAALNIGQDAIVFVDDNPVERSIIRQLRPVVAVPEMPEDPAGYVAALDRMRYFETPTLSREDLDRADYYRADEARRDAAVTSADIDGFLISLDLVARVAPIGSLSVERSAQLIGRSNQFNVTTRRHAASDLLRMADDPDWVTLTLSLGDRFGDNGLISVVLARVDHAADALVIDTWLMSCRVLKRGVEAAVLELLVGRTRALGLTALIGDYIPTPKNVIVQGLFAELGFTEVARDADGATRWRLDVSSATVAPTHHVRIEEQPANG